MVMEAKVKSVLSGDTLVLHHTSNPRNERTLSLAFVSAPRFKRDGDEPFAFESRDFLRRLLVGRVVQFRVLYKIPTGVNREYGIVSLPGGGQQLPDASVTEGWVKLRDDAARKDDSQESQNILERLEVLEARAKADSKGLWQESGGRIECSYEVPDAKALAEELKGKQVDAIIEKVLSGDRLIVRLMPSPSKHTQTMLLIAGIRAPSTRRTNPSDGQEQPPEPFGEEAQLFVETRLLQRNVHIDVLGVSPQNQLIGTVKHPIHGSVAPHVLKAGLARCADQHSTMLGSEMGQLRQAEKAAKDARTGLFRGHVAAKRPSGEVEAVVCRVQTADTLYIRNKAGGERRVNLSSVRQPKPSDPKQAPWGPEAKEFLRKRLIGKHVKVHTDGKRPPQDNYDEREMVTVTHNGKNVGLTLVENGFASVIRHRADDTDRSPIYDELLLAEQEAQSAGKGMWAPKPPAAKHYVDYSESLDKAKRQLSLLSRQRKVPAIVDFVKSGSRFTVLVPRENAKLTFVLSGIRAPRSARNPNEKSEPFGQEALDFANRRCLQRDVEIDVEDLDKVGGFIGTLYVNRESFAKLLVEEGLASVHAHSAEKSGNATELFAAEQRAKDAHKGLWHDWDPAMDAEDGDAAAGPDAGQVAGANGTADGAAAASDAPRKKDYRDVYVTHVDPESLHLKVQLVGSGTSALVELTSAFRKFHLGSGSALSGPPKAGDLVAAKFSEDGEWYRARVRRNDREAKRADVVYIDYGNAENIPWDRLRPLGDTKRFGLEALRPQAVDAELAFLQFPQNAEYRAEAVDFVARAAADRQLVANVEATSAEGALVVTLFDPKESEGAEQSVNAEVVGEGLAMFPRKLRAWEKTTGAREVLQGLRKKEEEARRERRGMWEYGDLTED
ncbi:hypothetical protein BDY21DRAFT_291735 [Lineolata rhizophorae]|uniref:Probable endonuclease LCL3 n=1 Tax=Lineolata rhizophorae TaxID=578093 RepID=A0A6A6NR54_9PEZI|nr:hypothetical protein BDY21DRAFT_291735 [Lineolata rhizophorae]